MLNWKTLMLTASGTPTVIVSCRRALTLVGNEKAIIIKSYPGALLHSSPAFVTTNFSFLPISKNEMLTIGIPSVIQCTKSDWEPKRYTNVLRFNRKNIYIRDGGRCQYCNRKVTMSGFTFDHVVPRSVGGKTWWNNIVVCCRRCNSQKSSDSYRIYKRRLTKEPLPLKIDASAPVHIVNQLSAEIPHETWTDHIYWHLVLDR